MAASVVDSASLTTEELVRHLVEQQQFTFQLGLLADEIATSV